MSESISELRKVCIKAPEENPSKSSWHDWLDLILYRSISIYVTKFFLKLGISANQATVISLLLGITSGVFFLFKGPEWWILGGLLMYLSALVDYVDGQLARYHKSTSRLGEYLDRMTGGFILSYTFICMTFGIYSMNSSNIVLAMGFMGVFSLLLQRHSALIKQQISHNNQSGLSNRLLTGDTLEPGGKISALIKHASSFLVSFRYGIVVMAFAIIDYFVSPVTMNLPVLGALAINARYLYFAVNAIAMFAGVIVVIVYTLMNLQREEGERSSMLKSDEE